MKLRRMALGVAVVAAVAGSGSIAATSGVAGAAGPSTTGRPLPQLLAEAHGSLGSLLQEAGLAAQPSTTNGSSPRIVTPSQWSTVPMSTFGAATTVYLESISCGTPTNCVTVGFTEGADDIVQPVAAVYRGGSWTASAVLAPVGHREEELASVSCTTATFCMAVGEQFTPAKTSTTVAVATATSPLVEQWNGQTWSIVATPTTPPAGWTSVSCTSPAACTATGVATSGTPGALTYLTVVAQWNGTAWSSSRLPTPATTIRLPTSVSCTGPMFCVAVGWQAPIAKGGTTTGPTSMFDLQWNGSAWTSSVVVTPGPTHELLAESVSCATPSICVAAGAQLTEKGTTTAGESAVLEQWNGATWSPVAVPGVGVRSVLLTVDCFGPTSCVAGGVTTTATSSSTAATTSQPLVVDWNGTSWSPASLAHWTSNGGGTAEVAVTAVSCFPGVQCVAVGVNGDTPFSMVAPVTRSGYAEVASDGGLFAFGTTFYGSMGGKP